jgi:hypothetical protein
MLLCIGTGGKIQLVTDVACTVDVHASTMDVDGSGNVTTGSKNTAITTATTTDIVSAPSASTTTRNVKTINVRNKGAGSVNVTAQHTDGTTTVELFRTYLAPQATLQYVEGAGWSLPSPVPPLLRNYSVAAQGPGFAADTYLTASNILLPSTLPLVGTIYRCWFDMTKTAASTAASTVTLRFGTAGAIGDAAICAFAFGVGTAVVDAGLFFVEALFRTVGAGTAAVVQGVCSLTSLASTGLASTVKGVVTTSAGFNSTPAGSIIGLSYNGGASFAGTVQLVRAELVP